jgi:hypothetical protein
LFADKSNDDMELMSMAYLIFVCFNNKTCLHAEVGNMVKPAC